jgi:hypothetical protein
MDGQSQSSGLVCKGPAWPHYSLAVLTEVGTWRLTEYPHIDAEAPGLLKFVVTSHQGDA